MAVLAYPLFPQDFPGSEKKDFEVQPERNMIDIPDIQAELFFPRNRVSPVDLRPSSNARLNLMPSRLFGRVAVQVVHQQRARTDQTHVALKHVDQLRQLIEAG